MVSVGSGLDGHEAGRHATPGVTTLVRDVDQRGLRDPAQGRDDLAVEHHRADLEEAHAGRGLDHLGELDLLLDEVDAAGAGAGLERGLDVGLGRLEHDAVGAEVVDRLDDEGHLPDVSDQPGRDGRGEDLGRGDQIADAGEVRERALRDAEGPERVVGEVPVVLAQVLAELRSATLALGFDRDDAVADPAREATRRHVRDLAAEETAVQVEVSLELLGRGVDVDEGRFALDPAGGLDVVVPGPVAVDERGEPAAEHLLGEEPAVVRDHGVQRRRALTLQEAWLDAAVPEVGHDEVVDLDRGRLEPVPAGGLVPLRHPGRRLGQVGRGRRERVERLAGVDKLPHQHRVDADRHQRQRERDRLARLLLDLGPHAADGLGVVVQRNHDFDPPGVVRSCRPAFWLRNLVLISENTDLVNRRLCVILVIQKNPPGGGLKKVLKK